MKNLSFFGITLLFETQTVILQSIVIKPVSNSLSCSIDKDKPFLGFNNSIFSRVVVLCVSRTLTVQSGTVFYRAF